MTEPRVKNASRAKEVRASSKREKEQFDLQTEDLRSVLSTRPGRRFVWRMIAACGVFNSVNHASGSQVYYLAGKQDIGHLLMGEIIKADENRLLQMMTESKDEENG